MSATFERKVKLRYPFPWQQEVLADASRFKVCFIGRRAGKSETGLISAVTGHGPKRELRGALQGGVIWWVLPTFPLAVDAWDRLIVATRNCYTRKSEVERRIHFPGGGSIGVKSSDNPDGLRGVGLNGVVLDELKDHGPKVWGEALRPALSDKQGWLLGVGTPGAIGGWSHTLFQQAKTLPGWKTWQLPSSSNPALKPEELVDARRGLGATVFAREYEAQFISSSGNMFKRMWLRFYEQAISGFKLGETTLHHSAVRVFAVADLAATVKTHSDYSVIGVFGLTPDNRLLVLEVIRGKLEAPEVTLAFRDVNERWKPSGIFVETGPYNNLFMSVLRAEGLPIREVKADKDKITRAEPAVAQMEGGRIWFPNQAVWLDDFVTELCDFPDASHDDCVDVLAYAVRVAVSAGANRVMSPYQRQQPQDEGRESGWLVGR